MNGADEHGADLRNVAYEYVLLMGAAVEMTEPRHIPPVNHLIQEAFLLHVRNLLDFFCLGKHGSAQKAKHSMNDDLVYREITGGKSLLDDKYPDIHPLRNAINKSIAHLTRSRNLKWGGSALRHPFDGPTHLCGTVNLIENVWRDFLGLMTSEFRELLDRQVESVAGAMKVDAEGAPRHVAEAARGEGGARMNYQEAIAVVAPSPVSRAKVAPDL